MYSWLITNKYFVSNNFNTIKDLLLNSAKENNIMMDVFNNIEIIDILSSNNFKKPDFVLFWDKDIKLAKYIENCGIRVFNSSYSIRICDDKSLTYLYLLDVVRQPKTIFSPLIYYHSLADDDEFINLAISKLKFPFIFKECFGSFGKQVYLINSKNELVEKIRNAGNFPFIMQEYIKESYGKDLRVYVVGDKIVGAIKRENINGDFRANIEIGGKAYKYDLNSEEKDMALKVAKHLKLDFCGVDILFGKDNTPILCEVNSNAYFLGMNNSLNIKVEDEIIKYIINEIYE